MRTSFAAILSFSVGFLSLASEVLWVRLIGFVHSSTPKAFGYVLGLFLIGIAIGASLGKKACERWGSDSAHLLAFAGAALAVSGCVDMFGVTALLYWLGATGERAIEITVVVTSALFKSIVFPIAHHLGSEGRPTTIGKSVSRVYAANVAGACAGPIVVGFILLDYVTTLQAFRGVGLAQVALATVCLLAAERRVAFTGGAVLAIVAAVQVPAADEVFKSKIPGMTVEATSAVGRVVETKSGILHTFVGAPNDDIVYGGNVYDGRTNVQLFPDTNGVHRAYFLALLHPQPERVLVIGLSTGAWTRVLESFPETKIIDVVEINAGYRDIIKDYPRISPLLTSPKVRLHIDDGRRWIQHRQDEKYDLVVMNTTFYWRAYSTNLLSVEFLEQIKGRLNNKGILAYNSTGSIDVFRTAAEVFPHARKYSNFVIASNQPLPNVSREAAISKLSQIKIGDYRPELLDPDHKQAFDRMLSVPLIDIAQAERAAGRRGELITDLNMLTEYKYGRKF